jgi:hypothetical protein
MKLVVITIQNKPTICFRDNEGTIYPLVVCDSTTYAQAIITMLEEYIEQRCQYVRNFYRRLGIVIFSAICIILYIYISNILSTA